MLVVIPGLIALVGLASMLHIAEVRSTVQHLVEMLSPGPSGKLLTEAAAQGASGGATAAIVGLIGALIAGMFAVAQVERSANRLSGLDHDRPTAKRYGLAFLLAIPVGILLSAGVVLIGAGGPVVDGLGLEGGARVVWEVARWPLGLLVAGAGIMLLLRVAPVRRLGSTRHLMAGTAIAVVLWGVFTGLLSLYFALSNSTSQTYGPLLAVIALLLWAGATSLALHLGITACVELER
jgi:YihY family inner membrane protein